MSGYIGTQPVPQATQTRQTFTATAAQTSFATVGYQAGYLDVFLNGVKLVDGTDYTATNGSDVVLTTGAALDDILEIVAYTAFEVLNQSFTGTTTTDVLTTTGAFTSLGIDDNASSTAITIDASGNVGIGTASPVAPLDIYTPAGTEAKLVVRNGTSTAPVASIELRRGSTSQTFGADTYGDYRIKNEGGNLSFDYGEGGTTTERMRIDSSGNVGIAKTPDTNRATIGHEFGAAGYSFHTRASGTLLFLNRAGTDGAIIEFYNDAVLRGSISVSGSSTAYNTTSDYRLKENITPVQGAADIVKMMRPCTYTFKSDGSWHDGFLAHELQELHPRAVIGEKDAIIDEEYEVTPAVEATYDDEGVELTAAVPAVMGTRSVPDYQGVDYSKLTPILTAALQEALNKIDALEARLTALEATP